MLKTTGLYLVPSQVEDSGHQILQERCERSLEQGRSIQPEIIQIFCDGFLPRGVAAPAQLSSKELFEKLF
jgi:hypothetical protein